MHFREFTKKFSETDTSKDVEILEEVIKTIEIKNQQL